MSETMVKLLTFPSVAGAAASYQVRMELVVLPCFKHPRLFDEYPRPLHICLGGADAQIYLKQHYTESEHRVNKSAPTATS